MLAGEPLVLRRFGMRQINEIERDPIQTGADFILMESKGTSVPAKAATQYFAALPGLPDPRLREDHT